jgi:hypothetical protein
VNPQDHRPHAPIRCFAPCLIGRNRAGRSSRCRGCSTSWGTRQRPEGKGDRTEAGDESPGGDSGKASNQRRRRAGDKGKAKVQDSWATGWLERGEASRRKKEEKKEARRKQESQEERLKKEEEQRLLEQLERFIPEQGKRRRERARKVQEDAEADLEIRAELVGISRFLVEWESQQWDCEELDIFVEKAWPAHIANHPEAALNVNIT